MKFRVLIVFTLVLCLGVQAQDSPYEMFGHESKVKYETLIAEFLIIRNSDTMATTQALAFNIEDGLVLFLDKNDSVIDQAVLEPDQIFRWLSTDPLLSVLPNYSPYTYVASNPIFYRDENGEILIGLNKKSAQRAEKEIQKTFKHNEALKNMFSIGEDCMTFRKINPEDFENAIGSLCKTDQALARGYYQAINMDEKIYIGVYDHGDKILTEENNYTLTADDGTTFSTSTSYLIQNSIFSGYSLSTAGGGFTVTENSGDKVVLIGTSQKRKQEVAHFAGSSYTLTNEHYSVGEVMAHEIVGHATLDNLNNRSKSSYQGSVEAVQISNIYRAVLGVAGVRTGSDHRFLNEDKDIDYTKLTGVPDKLEKKVTK